MKERNILRKKRLAVLNTYCVIVFVVWAVKTKIHTHTHTHTAYTFKHIFKMCTCVNKQKNQEFDENNGNMHALIQTHTDDR